MRVPGELRDCHARWFAQDYAEKYPKAVEALFVDVLRLLPHFHCPATHWKHIQATNPIESTFRHGEAACASPWGLTSRRTDDGVQTAGGHIENVAPV